MKPPASRTASRLKPTRLVRRRSSSGKKPKRLTNITPLLNGRGNGDIEDMKSLSAFLSPDMFQASFTSPRLTPPPFNLSFGSEFNDELFAYMDKLDGNMATCSTPLSQRATSQRGACGSSNPTPAVLSNTSNPADIKNHSIPINLESNRSSFMKTPDKASKNNLHLSCWSLPEKVLEQYTRRGITSMFQWQAECLMLPGVLSGGNLVYSAPTSAGKTLIAELLALKCVLELKKKVIIILPFVSIAQEKSMYLQQIFEPVGVKVGGFMGGHSPSGGFTAVDIAICTIEKANSLVNRLLEEKSCHQIGAVVVDELHMIGDSHRGYLLELLLTKLMYVTKKGRIASHPAQSENDPHTHGSIQLIGMSATLPNLDTLASWLGAELYHTDFRPVPLKEMVKIGSTLYSNELEKIREFDKSDLYPGDEDDILSLCAETVSQGHSVLIFCPTKNWCENLTSTISRAQFLNGGESSDMDAHLDRATLLGVCEQLRRTQVGLDPVLEKSVPSGVAFHHAGLTFEEREIIEGAFRQMLIKILIATSTLSSGVNLPARLVIVRTPFFQRTLLDVLVYKQMVGRAGRKGVDEAGESILICKPNEKPKVIGLLKSAPKPVQSCLGGKSEGKMGDLVAMKRALLEIIASTTANTPHEIETYVTCTLLYAEMAKKSPESDPTKSTKDLLIQSTLQFLVNNEFIAMRSTASTSPSELEYYATQLGVATMASALSPDEALVVFEELRKARRNFVLENELHIIYLVTPVYVQNQWPNIDWYKYLCLWERLPPDMRHVADTLGIRESFLARAIQGRILERTAAQRESLRIHRRFFTALALHGLVHEVPIAEVTRRYGASKGLLQTLQTAAGTFAGMVTVFCARLGWKNLELLLSQFQNRLTFGIERELCDLVRISLLNGFRARVLYNEGFHTLAAVATTNPTTIETCLRNAVPFRSHHQLGGEESTTWCAKLRRGMSEREAAKLIVQEAQGILSEELHIPMSAWTNAQPTVSVKSKSNTQPTVSVDLRKNTQPTVSVDLRRNAQPTVSVDLRRNAQPTVSVDPRSNNQPTASVDLNTLPTASVDPRSSNPGNRVISSGMTRGQRKSPNIDNGGVKKPRISPNDDLTHSLGVKPTHLLGAELTRSLRDSVHVNNRLQLSNKATCSNPLESDGPSTHHAGPCEEVSESKPLSGLVPAASVLRDTNWKWLQSSHCPKTDNKHSLPVDQKTNKQLPPVDQKTNKQLPPVDQKTNKRSLPVDQKSSKQPLPVDQKSSKHLPMDQKTTIQLPLVDQKTTQLPPAVQCFLTIHQEASTHCPPLPFGPLNDDKQRGDNDRSDVDLESSLPFTIPDSFPLSMDTSMNFSCQTLALIDGACTTKDKQVLDGACTTKNGSAEFIAAAENIHGCEEPTTIAESPIESDRGLTHPLNLKQVQGASAVYNLRSTQNSDTTTRTTCTDNNPQTPANVTNKSTSRLANLETPSQMSLKELSSLCSSQLSQSGITIIDVTTNKRLFQTFVSECLEQPYVSISVAAVNVNQENGIGSVIVKPTEAPGIPLLHRSEQVVGVAFCWGDMDVYYLSLCQNPPGDESCCVLLQDRIQAVGKIITTIGPNETKLIAYDVKRHAQHLLLSCGVLPMGRVLDPRVASWMLDPDAKEKTIHKMALQYLPDQPLLSEEEGYEEMPLSSLATHASDPQMRAAAETVLSSLLMLKLKTLLEAEDLYEPFINVEMPSLLVLSKMELNGIGFSPEECNSQKEILETRLGELEREAYGLAHRSFSLTSPEDVAQVLFIELKLPPNLDGKQAKTLGPKGRRATKRVQHLSTAKDVLEKIKSLHPLPGIVLEWRRISSTVTKNVFPLFKEAVSHTHIRSVRIHANCQIHTATGRVTISDPSLQMIPKEYDLGPSRTGIPKFTLGSTDGTLLSESQCFDVCNASSDSKPSIPSSVCMRNVFVPFPGGVFLAADYSQLELRILAHVSGDKKLQRYLNAEGDVFRMIAGEWLVLPPKEVSDKQRQQAKQVCYGMIYGIGAKALGEQLGISEDDAYQFMESFKSKYPSMKKFISKTIQDCKEKGHVCTLLQRKRFLPNIHSPNIHARSQAERQAVNTTIQGSAADLVKTAMVNIDKKLAELFPSSCLSLTECATRQPTPVTGAHLVLQLHDELLYEVCQDDLDKVATIVRHEMENALKLSVKFPVKIKVGQSWGRLDPYNK